MPNLRVITDNTIDRVTTGNLTASSTGGSFVASNLQLARKSDVWRSVGTTARLSAAWAAAEPLQAVALPFCNLSPTATVRVRVTNEAQATNLLASPNTFSSSNWTKTSVAVGASAVGPDGGAASATTLTAAGANAILAQAATVVSGNFVSSIFIRRRSGSGAVSIANAANTAWTPLALSSNWIRVSNDGGSTSSTSAGLRLQLSTSGDSIDVAFAQVEAGSIATSFYDGTRPLGYIDSWQSYAYDSGAVLACPAPAAKLRGFTASQAASAYAFGGGATARHWLPASVNAYGLAVDIADASNLQGYIEAAYLVAGPMWESATNFDYGASAQLVDSTKNSRNDAGDLISDAGTVSKKLSIPFSKLSASDRATLWSILRSGGTRYPLFISMFPGDTDLARERDHQVYGKLAQMPAMALPYYNLASATLEVESV